MTQFAPFQFFNCFKYGTHVGISMPDCKLLPMSYKAFSILTIGNSLIFLMMANFKSFNWFWPWDIFQKGAGFYIRGCLSSIPKKVVDINWGFAFKPKRPRG